jgi:hypothetical protein
VSAVALEARAIVRAGIGLAFPDLVLPGFPGDDQRDPVHPLHTAEYFERLRLMRERPELRPPPAPRDPDGIWQGERTPIPFSRIQHLLRDLLGQQDLRHIRGLTIDVDAVEVEVYALNEHGRPFLRGGEAAVDRIHIPVGRL